LQGWLNVLDAGGTRAQVVRGFSESVEFVQDTAADLKAWVKAQGVQDTIVGGAGANKLTGGLLSDVFVFEANQATQTTITDFEAWDVLSFHGYTLDSFMDFQVRASQQGADTVMSIGTDFRLVLQNVQLDMITADQVEFFSL
jgi:Ca2+-binding RTX toxin-like protein